MIFNNAQRHSHFTLLGLLTISTSAAVLLSGCGGVTNSTQSFGSYTANGPVIFGLQAQAAIAANPNVYVETSGAVNSSSQAIAFGAVASTALPIATETDTTTGTIPLGFGPGAQYIDNVSFGGALHPGDSFTFGTYVANGLDASGNFTAISGVTASSTDFGITNQALAYTPNYNGPLANAQYRTTLTVPAGTTTGLKQITAQVTDAAPNTANHSPSTTTFDTIVLAGNDSAVLAQVVDSTGAKVPGAVATIDGADAPGYVGPGQTVPTAATSSVADGQGVIILFAPAGAHTVTVTSGALTTTLAVTTTVGTLTGTTTTTSSTAGLQIAFTGAAAAVAKAKVLRH